MPESVTTIGKDIFYKCEKLEEIIFADASYKEKEGLEKFIKQYENKIKIQSLEDIIKTKTINNKKEINKPEEPER